MIDLQLIFQGKRLIRTHASLLVILLIFYGLGIIYNVSLPLFEAPDEKDHFLYVNWLAKGRGLPHIDRDLYSAGHEIIQPPLYYVMLAPFVAAIDTSDVHQIAPVNPYWRQGAGINVHYHTKAEQFPYRNTALAVHLARFVSTLMASLAVVSAYGLARMIAPKQAVLAAAFVAFNPQFISISAAVNNASFVAAICGLTLLILVRQIVFPCFSWQRYVLLGGLWGLATLAKLSGLALGSVLVVGVFFANWQHKSWRLFVWKTLCIAAGIATIAGWWFVRNWVLYGDPLAWKTMIKVLGTFVRPTWLSWSDALLKAAFLRRSFWAFFAYGIPSHTHFYLIINSLVFLAVVGLVIWFVKTGRRQLAKTWAVLLLVIWSLVSFISLLQWIRQVKASNQGRFMFTAITSLAVLFALGLSSFSRRYTGFSLAVMALLLVWAISAPFQAILPAFAQPSPLPSEAEIPNRTPIYFGAEINLLGYQLPDSVAQIGRSLKVELYWQATAPITESYVIALHALDSAGKVVAGLDTIPYRARYPTAVWQPGRAFKDSYVLPIQLGASPGQASLFVAVYPWGRPEQALPVLVGETPVGQDVAVTKFKIAAKETEYLPPNEANVVFGQQARLIGFEAPTEIISGHPFTLTLYWQALIPDGNDYTVFVHLLDNSDKLVAQADSPPQNNGYPTSIWTSGEQIRDPHVFFPADKNVAGHFQIVVGLYDPDAKLRLPAFDADGVRWLDDVVELTTVEFVQE